MVFVDHRHSFQPEGGSIAYYQFKTATQNLKILCCMICLLSTKLNWGFVIVRKWVWRTCQKWVVVEKCFWKLEGSDLNRREADVSLKLHHLSLNFNARQETYIEFFSSKWDKISLDIQMKEIKYLKIFSYGR